MQHDVNPVDPNIFALSDKDDPKSSKQLLAKVFRQQLGFTYSETSSPVKRYETIRMLSAMAAEKQVYMHQVDISNTYLNCKLHEDVFMKQPEGFVSNHHPEKVSKLKNAIYGVKQSGRSWNSTLDAVLNNIVLIMSLFCTSRKKSKYKKDNSVEVSNP